MINKETKRKLASRNGNAKELRKAEIIEQIKKEYPHLDDEVAILRKIVYVLAKKIKEQHPDVDLSEIEEYNNNIENIKERIDI